MSDSIPAFRKKSREDLANLAKAQFQHDLEDADRDKLKSAAITISTWTTLSSFAGLALGALLAHRIRMRRQAIYKVFRATEKPTGMSFADGKEVDIPDLTPLLRPTTKGDLTTYAAFSTIGFILWES